MWFICSFCLLTKNLIPFYENDNLPKVDSKSRQYIPAAEDVYMLKQNLEAVTHSYVKTRQSYYFCLHNNHSIAILKGEEDNYKQLS